MSIEEREVLQGAKNGADEDGKSSPRIGLTQVSLVSDGGEVRLFDLTPSTTVRVTEKEVNEEVGKYLGLVASTRDQDVRRMTISTAGSGERNLLVSYISEVPVWKSTYRIVIPNEGKPLLQGWAIVDNTVGEDWKDVELSLVAGSPQSFVQELSQPYYTRRPVVALPENAMLTPQTHEATMETCNSSRSCKRRRRSRWRMARPSAAPRAQASQPEVASGVIGGRSEMKTRARLHGTGHGSGAGAGGGVVARCHSASELQELRIPAPTPRSIAACARSGNDRRPVRRNSATCSNTN